MTTKRTKKSTTKKLSKKVANKYAAVSINEVDRFSAEAIKLIPTTDALRNYANKEDSVEQRWEATMDGKAIGLVTIEYPHVHGHEYLENTKYIQVIVSPKARGHGIGDKLLKTAIEEASNPPKHWAGFTNHSEGFKHLAKKYGIRDSDDLKFDENDPHWNKDGTFDEDGYNKKLYGWD